MQHFEHQIQCFLCDLLDYKLVNPKKGYYFAVPNGEIRGKDPLQSARVMQRLKKEGVRNGVADIVVLLKGGDVIFVEMKTDKGKQSASQKEFEKIVKELGYNYIILHNTDECEQFAEAITSKSYIEKIIECIDSLQNHK